MRASRVHATSLDVVKQLAVCPGAGTADFPAAVVEARTLEDHPEIEVPWLVPP